ncbi:metallophosphoesterase 1 [Exaiptasia diaphana]|uniref:Calcineurin-like phosphoesterase domain-containing protein n=1 Tax=Exaiptasia diaphana TaxID=2652724 RepID=A0A913XE85_EXADI|nr:metallophosphoesterase 1 [Exaiptasia diaphana]KXJ12789.1 Metallophosphoesterase 1 [Exaiptasia diaphana]
MFPRRMKFILWFTCFVFIFCEWLVYYLVIFQCSWPELSPEDKQNNPEPLNVMLLSDPHLLGTQDGHWFDKLRREWQMERAFQTAATILQPEVVFVLGDLFDEGMKCNDEEFDDYVNRFRKMFRHSEDVHLHVTIGNHDIGFHDIASSNEKNYQRFSKAFNIPDVGLFQIKGNVFVTVNSIGLEGDNCTMCESSVNAIKQVANKLHCNDRNQRSLRRNLIKELAKKEECELPFDAPLPILVQHFPLYRKSESKCSGIDAPPPEEMKKENRPKWEVVSEEATSLLLKSFMPRLVLSGHTHHGCYVIHEDGTPELTIPSFSWRNRNNPSFIMAVITPKKFLLSKCFIPQENTVIAIYVFSAIVLVIASASVLKAYLKSLQRKLLRMLQERPSKPTQRYY